MLEVSTALAGSQILIRNQMRAQGSFAHCPPRLPALPPADRIAARGTRQPHFDPYRIIDEHNSRYIEL
jgi:hypothetical protein